MKLTLSANQQKRNTIRKSVRVKRRALSNEEQQLAADKLCQTLIETPQVLEAETIALYLANDGEIALTPFIEWCWQQGKQVTLPVIHPFSKGHLLFLRYNENTQLVDNRFGIPEPQLSAVDVVPFKKIDVILTPLVAFDKQGGRLGMGGGFYDRTLASWYQKTQDSNQVALNTGRLVYPVGVAHDCQEVSAVPTEEWDIPLPQIITPTQSITGKLGSNRNSSEN